MLLVTTALLITVCTQNLQLYALPDGGKSALLYQEREEALLQRFIRASCDIIAVQELVGGDAALQRLLTLLNLKRNVRYKGIIGVGNDTFQKTGFIVNSERLKVLKINQHDDIWLPRLTDKQRPRAMLRAPLEILLQKRKGIGTPITIINIHLKSKHRAQDDPARLGWEGARVEAAEYLRRIAEKRKGDLIILGDRNSGESSASAAILNGRRHLADLEGCIILKKGILTCRGKPRKNLLINALKINKKLDGFPGSYVYKNKPEWIDSILINRRKNLENQLNSMIKTTD